MLPPQWKRNLTMQSSLALLDEIKQVVEIPAKVEAAVAAKVRDVAWALLSYPLGSWAATQKSLLSSCSMAGLLKSFQVRVFCLASNPLSDYCSSPDKPGGCTTVVALSSSTCWCS